MVVGPGVRTGVPLLVDNPREVGADRVMNTLAAHRLFGTACVVVDFGTSTNIDVVSGQGRVPRRRARPGHRDLAGGAGHPGGRAAHASSWSGPRSVIGKNTVECLQSGVLYGFAGQVDGLVRRILAELGPKAGPVTVLGTGGLAPLMAGESETITEYVPGPDPARPAPDLPAQRPRSGFQRRARPARRRRRPRRDLSTAPRSTSRNRVVSLTVVTAELRDEPRPRTSPTTTFPSRCGSAGRSGRTCWPRATTRTRSPSRARTRLREVRAAHPDLPPDTATGDVVGVTGRVIFLRNTGKLCFATLREGDGTELQAMISLALVGAEELARWKADGRPGRPRVRRTAR